MARRRRQKAEIPISTRSDTPEAYVYRGTIVDNSGDSTLGGEMKVL